MDNSKQIKYTLDALTMEIRQIRLLMEKLLLPKEESQSQPVIEEQDEDWEE